MQRTKSLAMGVVGPRHQLGKTTGVVAVLPQLWSHPSIPKDSHTLLIPVAQQDTHPGLGLSSFPRLLRAAEAGGAAVPPLRASPAKVLMPRGRVRQWQKSHVCQSGEGTARGSAPGTHTPLPGMQPWIFRPRAHALPGAVISRDKVEILRTGLIPVW